jgi:hypothetical protein
MMFFLNNGFRVIAHDRRGPADHGQDAGEPRRPSERSVRRIPGAGCQ